MTYAVDDIEHIRQAMANIKAEVTTEDRKPACPTCAGQMFVFKTAAFGASAIPCPACRPRNREVAK